MNKYSAFFCAFSILGLAPASFSAETTPMSTQSTESGFYSSTELQWKDSPALPAGAKVAVLEGDPSKDGMFVIRIRLPDGFQIPPHTHPKTERITILTGTFHLAMGERLDRSSAQPLTAGSYGFWPAGMKHTAWAEGETTVQLHGLGPWVIKYVNTADDPRNKK